MQKEKEKNLKSFDEKLRLRHWSNKKIIELIGEIADKYPDFRFWQILCIFGYITEPDRFYEESYDTYNNMLEVLKELDKEGQQHLS